MREFNARVGPVTLALEWRLTLFTVLLLPLLVTLGFWQLDRAVEKQYLADRHAQRMALPPVALASLVSDELPAAWADRRVDAHLGFAPDHYLLLDNRIRDGRFGYEVLALGITATGEMVAVNLGWIEGDAARRQLPDIQLPAGEVAITARVYLPTSSPYLLAEQDPVERLPAVIQAFEPATADTLLGQISDREVLPLELRLDAEHPLALASGWPVVNVSPDKHRGYAAQWFTMAGVLFIAFLLRSSNLLDLARGRR